MLLYHSRTATASWPSEVVGTGLRDLNSAEDARILIALSNGASPPSSAATSPTASHFLKLWRDESIHCFSEFLRPPPIPFKNASDLTESLYKTVASGHSRERTTSLLEEISVKSYCRIHSSNQPLLRLREKKKNPPRRVHCSGCTMLLLRELSCHGRSKK